MSPQLRFRTTVLLFSVCVRGAGLQAEKPQPGLPVIGPEAYQLLTQLYEYDREIPLEARTVEIKPFDGRPREKIVLRTTQGFVASGYLQFPKEPSSPCPCVLLLHGWSGSKDSWYQDFNYISGGNIRTALLERGCAVFCLDAQCHGDRIAVNDYAPVNHYINEQLPRGERRKGYFTQREIYTQTVVDYRRVLDYLETRTELNSQRIGLIGYSMGGTQTFMLTGVEPRIKVAVACATPSETTPFTIYAPQNYVHGIGDRPFFVVAGNNDTMCPVGHAKELYDLIDSPTKDLRFYGGSHKLSHDFVPHAVEWITARLTRDQHASQDPSPR